MPISARIVSGPGGGKTHRLTEDIMPRCLGELGDPFRFGFVSFTRAARREASLRAGDRFGVRASELERDGYFRTLHSVAFKQLNLVSGDLITGTAEDTAWLRDVTDDERAVVGGRDYDDDYLTVPQGYSKANKALALWDTARNRLVPLRRVYDAAEASEPDLPDLRYCEWAASRYEARKRKDGRLDFCDLLMRFSGVVWTGVHDCPFDEVLPQGDVPLLPVWAHDEAQDASPLTMRVFRRLIEPCQWVYLAGDSWQAVYSFAGADGDVFMKWPVAKEEVLPVSYRCDSKILAYGDALMAAGGLPQRPFRSLNEGGIVEHSDIESAISSIKPDEDALVLARTNEYARSLAAMLDEELIPWVPLRGGGGHAAPAKAAAIAALETLRGGGAIDGEGWWRITQLLPAKVGGTSLFEHGTKTRWDDKEYRQAEAVAACPLGNLDWLGATEALKSAVENGRYVEWLEGRVQTMARAAARHGVAALSKPMVKLGTCHSSKGLGADRVILLDKIPKPTQAAIGTPEGMAEERRVWFVSATRAKHHLTIASSAGEGFPGL